MKQYICSSNGRNLLELSPCHVHVGINCRFGMRGVSATAHFDGARNFVAMLRGKKR